MDDKKEKRKKIGKTVLYWVILNLGTLLLAVGVYFFKGPNNFATGGVSGIAIILAKYVPLSQSDLMLIMNVSLLIIGFIFLGKGCTFKTAYCSVVYSVEMRLMQLIPAEVLPLPITNQTFMEFIYAMLLTGIASAILFNCGASSGGTDIVALIVKKFTKIKNIGSALFVTDCAIAASTFFIFDVKTGLYSILGLFVKAFLVDGVIEQIGKSNHVTIITSHPEAITPFITEKMHRGYTRFKATGGYTGEDRTVIITVLKRVEAIKLKQQIHKTDPTSFVIVTDANEILGKGFRNTL